MFKKVQKRSVTMLEIMIVIFLIALVGGVVAYNMRGSLDEGKRFKTEQAQRQVRDILLLQLSQGNISGRKIAANPLAYLENSGLLKNPENYLKDGWGDSFKIEYVNDDFRISSKNLDKFKEKKEKALDALDY